MSTKEIDSKDFSNNTELLQRETIVDSPFSMIGTEASKDVTGLEGIDLNFLPTQNMAGCGLAKGAGDESGPPPESGPTPQGLASIIKRGRKY